MFSNILNIFKSKDFLTTMEEDFKVMLDNASEMFELVCKRLIHNNPETPLKERIYALDKEINDMEREIRRRVMEHLAFNPKEDISMCLILMSVVKDAERVGDYSKNLYEVSKLLKNPIEKDSFAELFDIEGQINQLFSNTKEAFINANEDKARDCWELKTNIKTKCDDIIEELANSDRNANEAVSYALIARHFKRIASHLTNVATALIVPLSDLDYYREEK